MTMLHTEEHWVQTDHGKLYAKRWSLDHDASVEPAPIVLLHDSLGCVDLWRDFPAKLSFTAGRDVIAYDRLGFGRSDPHPGKLSPLHFIQDEALGGFRNLRESLELDHFIVFGHSVGGGMAIGCAAETSTACLGLITESTQAFAEDLTLQGIRKARLAFSEPGQLQRLEKYHGAKAEWVLHAWIDSWLAPEFIDWNLDTSLRRINCPLLVLHGDSDEYGSISHPKRITELAAGPATMRILPSCGHVPHREQEETVLAHVQTWLGSIKYISDIVR